MVSKTVFKTVGPPKPIYEINSVTKKSGLRLYEVAENKWYPSITTITSHINKDSIIKWRKRVGEKQATKISTAACSRGNKFHSMVECYLKNEPVAFDETNPLATYLFQSSREELNRINNIHLLESCLFSDYLRISGRVDCIAEFDGELSVIDFKTSTKPKKEIWIENYFVQETAYAVMYYERCGIPINKIVTIVAVEDGTIQVFEKNPDHYYDLLRSYIDDFMSTIK